MPPKATPEKNHPYLPKPNRLQDIRLQPVSNPESTEDHPLRPRRRPASSNVQPAQSNPGAPSPNVQPTQSNSGTPSPNVQPTQSNSGTPSPNVQPTQSNLGTLSPNVQPTQSNSGTLSPNVQPTQSNSGTPSPNVQPAHSDLDTPSLDVQPARFNEHTLSPRAQPLVVQGFVLGVEESPPNSDAHPQPNGGSDTGTSHQTQHSPANGGPSPPPNLEEHEEQFIQSLLMFDNDIHPTADQDPRQDLVPAAQLSADSMPTRDFAAAHNSSTPFFEGLMNRATQHAIQQFAQFPLNIYAQMGHHTGTNPSDSHNPEVSLALVPFSAGSGSASQMRQRSQVDDIGAPAPHDSPRNNNTSHFKDSDDDSSDVVMKVQTQTGSNAPVPTITHTEDTDMDPPPQNPVTPHSPKMIMPSRQADDFPMTDGVMGDPQSSKGKGREFIPNPSVTSSPFQSNTEWNMHLTRVVGLAVKDGVKEALLDLGVNKMDVGNSSTKGNDGDDEDDEGEFDPSPVRSVGYGKKGGKKSDSKNTFNQLLRDYLQSKKLWNNEKEIRPPPLPHDLDAYINNGHSGPSLADPRFDWFTSFTSTWNDQLLHLLAEEFLPKLEDSEAITFKREWKNVRYIKKNIAQKLARTRLEYRNRQPPDPSSSESPAAKISRVKKEKERFHKQMRRNSRRSGTYERRKRIIMERLHENPIFWRQAKQLLSELGEEGMSSDETETEASGLAVKTVRRVTKIWLDGGISEFWEAVERRGRALPTAAGNSALQRIYAARMPTGSSKKRVRYMLGLPGNYYCDIWWKSLNRSEQAAVDKQPPKELPSRDHLTGR